MKTGHVISGVAVASDGTYLMHSKQPGKRVQVVLAEPLVAAIDAESKSRGVSRTQFIESAILDRLHELGWQLD